MPSILSGLLAACAVAVCAAQEPIERVRVGGGMGTDACPVEIPVGTVFRAVGEKAQALFDYHPGRSLEEAAPVDVGLFVGQGPLGELPIGLASRVHGSSCPDPA